MTVDVPYLNETEIERDAQALLDEFASTRQITLEPPIPIEDIVEKHLKLQLEFTDMYEKLGLSRETEGGNGPDILGAIFFDERLVSVDNTLCPDDRPSMEGRFNFTLGHEAGHWRLHRHLFASAAALADLFERSAPPSFVCRSSERNQRPEWQANYHSACVLMPSDLVLAAWRDLFPDGRARVLQPPRSAKHPFGEISRPVFVRSGEVTWLETEEEALERVAKPLAERFRVSPAAMRIRLEKLGLLLRSVPMQQELGKRVSGRQNFLAVL